MDRVFIEYGLDFDNNRFGFGRSTEVESPDGTEYRTKEKIKIKKEKFYCRLWVLKRVFAVSSKEGLKIQVKKRNNFKLVFGIGGTRK